VRSRDRIFSRFGQKHNDVRTGSPLVVTLGSLTPGTSGRVRVSWPRCETADHPFYRRYTTIISWWKRIIVNAELWRSRVKEQHWSTSMAIAKDAKFEDRKILVLPLDVSCDHLFCSDYSFGRELARSEGTFSQCATLWTFFVVGQFLHVHFKEKPGGAEFYYVLI